MKLVQELLALSEGKTEFHGFKLYVQDAYGHGLDPSPIEKGEILPTEEGDEAEFMDITADGKKVVVKMGGKKQEVEPSVVVGAIHPSSTKPGGAGWAKHSIGDHFKGK